MASLWQAAPLSGIKVIELAGLAPGPFCGLLLADYGASVLRVDRTHPSAYNDDSPPAPTSDSLTRNKSSIALDLKSAGGLSVLRSLLAQADVLIDPFRPGVLEALGLPPSHLHAVNPRLVVARLTGFRRDGKYSAMAGHDVNYLAVSGVLSQLGRDGSRPPDFPVNLLGDFAGGGLMCALGVVMALLARDGRRGASGSGGRGQTVESNMVDGAAYLATFVRHTRKTPVGGGPRGSNLLDGGAPWYDVYETRDRGRWMSVGAIEPQFFARLLDGLGLDPAWNRRRWEREAWPELRAAMVARFAERTREEWEAVFDGTDACVAPVLEQGELEEQGYEQRPAVHLDKTPGRPVDQDEAWNPRGLAPGEGGRKILKEWLGWEEGEQYHVENGGLVQSVSSKL